MRVDAAIEREPVHRVVGLAAEVVLPGEDVDDIFRPADPGPRELVDQRGVRLGLHEHVHAVARPLTMLTERLRRERVEQLVEPIPVEAVGVVVLDGIDVALGEVAEDICIETSGQRDATFLEGEPQLGVTAGDAGEEQ